MVDFIKLNVSGLSESELLKNPLLEWKQKINLNTGEMIYPIKGKYFNLDIKLNPTRKEISGSIHKLRNEIKTSQNQNYDDFAYIDICEIIHHIQNVFRLDLKKTTIENLEIGLNIITNQFPEIILNKKIIVWKDKTPSRDNEYRGRGKYLEFEKSQLYFKIYDKAKQYDIPENILRIECKIIRNEFLKKYGINTLQDLLHKDSLRALQAFLFESFTSCIIVDDLSFQAFTESKELDIFTKGINPLYWKSFKNRASKKRFKDSLFQILEKYSLNTIQKEIESKLKAKGNDLLKCNEMNDFQIVEFQCSKNEMLRNEPYIYSHNVTTKKCMITGIDITHQKGESKFLSQSSIINLFKTEPETFKSLLSKFSPKKPEIMTFDKLCLEIAHNIRNRDSNKRNAIIRKTEYYRNSFFP